MDEIVAALKHEGRICQIQLSYLRKPQSERLTAVMQGVFPELTVLSLHSTFMHGASLEVDGLLGGFAPRLQTLRYTAFHFRSRPSYFGLPETSSISTFLTAGLPWRFTRSDASNLAGLAKLKSLRLVPIIFLHYHLQTIH